MRGLHKIILLGVFTSLILSCASNQSQEDLSLDASFDESSGAAASEDEFSVEDEFEETEVAETAEPVETAESDDFSEESLNDDLATTESQENTIAEETPLEEAPPELEIVEDDFAIEETAPPAPVVIEEPMIATNEEPVAISEQAPIMDANRKPIEITGVNYKANEQGGSVVIDASEPLSYYTRYNSDLNQFVIEVDNAILPARLKRSLNTKDIKGAIGAVDAYQNAGSKVARFVIQMRPGASEPVVQTAVNSLVIVANGIDQKESAPEGTVVDAGPADVLPISKLEEYLVGNTKFYGKKISIEMNNMDVREALQFIMDESGMNMVISDKVDGKVSLKLRQVPWDQALVIVMKAKSLGYNRQGNVLRIATLDELRKEEDDALKLLADRQKLETLKVRMFPVSYAKVDDLEKKLKEFMSERGKVVSDIRTNAIVVTETEENLVRVSKLIESLDIRPPQVLIEGKIVEAKESFTRAVGVSWNTVGSDIKIGQTRRGPVNLRPGVGVNTSYNTQGASLLLNLSVGTLDIFGNLTAALALREFEEKVKVISSPRILVLTNEPAIISQVQEVPVRQVTQNGTATQETFTFKPLALKMEVTPQVTTDGSIIMKVNVQRQIRGADIGTGQGANFSVDSREANTRVIVQNGQTAVIGGIFNSEMTSAEDGVPWLRELPFVGGLFRTNSKQTSKTELLVFVTPRIMSSGTGQNSTAPAM